MPTAAGAVVPHQARTLGPWSSAVELVNARERAQQDRQTRMQAGEGCAEGQPGDAGEGGCRGGAGPAGAKVRGLRPVSTVRRPPY